MTHRLYVTFIMIFGNCDPCFTVKLLLVLALKCKNKSSTIGWKKRNC